MEPGIFNLKFHNEQTWAEQELQFHKSPGCEQGQVLFIYSPFDSTGAMNLPHSVRGLNLDQFLATSSSATSNSSSQGCPEPAQALPVSAPLLQVALGPGVTPHANPKVGSVPWVTSTHRLTRNSATILDFRAALGLVEAVGKKENGEEIKELPPHGKSVTKGSLIKIFEDNFMCYPSHPPLHAGVPQCSRLLAAHGDMDRHSWIGTELNK